MNHSKKFFDFLIILISVFLLLGGKTYAQTTFVTLEGIVSDEEGSPLPGATVTVKNVETGYTKSTVTRETGRYLISGIQPGKYECEVSLPGFGTHVRRGVTFAVGARLTIDFVLKPAAIEEEVTVVAESPMVEVTKSEVSAVIEREKIDSLPLYDRNFSDLTIIKAGS